MCPDVYSYDTHTIRPWQNEESHLEMSKSHANVVSFDENVSYLPTSMNLYERNEHFFYKQNSY